ncbi:MAG: AN1-type zinc finger domain-containing protein [Nanoarchaeota archaeon]|nr:AN1-type zinc finger domain-containing protein [Nanoarchaeota archaeon]
MGKENKKEEIDLVKWYEEEEKRKKDAQKKEEDRKAEQEVKLEKNRRDKIPKKCQLCNSSFNIFPYICPYCKKYHCDKHRLPEDHKCPNPKLPLYMKKGLGSKKKGLYKIYPNKEAQAEVTW